MGLFENDQSAYEPPDIVQQIDELVAKADRWNKMRGLTTFEMELQAKLLSCRFEIVVLRDRLAEQPGA